MAINPGAKFKVTKFHEIGNFRLQQRRVNDLLTQQSYRRCCVRWRCCHDVSVKQEIFIEVWYSPRRILFSMTHIWTQNRSMGQEAKLVKHPLPLLLRLTQTRVRPVYLLWWASWGAGAIATRYNSGVLL